MGEHKHTDECLAYAARTGKAFCIAECRDSYDALELEKVLDDDELHAFGWAINQKFGSVAARYARVLAEYIKRIKLAGRS